MEGAVVSAIFSATLAEELLPLASIAVTTIVYWPVPSRVPAAGFWLKLIWLAGVQLSVAVTCASTLGTTPWQSAPAETVIGPGRFPSVGGVLSTTVKPTLQLELLPE